MTRPLLLLISLFLWLLLAAIVVGVTLWASRAHAIFQLDLPDQPSVWVWSQVEMDKLNAEIRNLRRDRDEWRRKAEAVRVCV